MVWLGRSVLRPCSVRVTLAHTPLRVLQVQQSLKSEESRLQNQKSLVGLGLKPLRSSASTN
jgi:hypothetical protein